MKAFEIVVRETLSSAANDARVARRRGVGLTFGDATADPRLRVRDFDPYFLMETIVISKSDAVAVGSHRLIGGLDGAPRLWSSGYEETRRCRYSSVGFSFGREGARRSN